MTIKRIIVENRTPWNSYEFLKHIVGQYRKTVSGGVLTEVPERIKKTVQSDIGGRGKWRTETQRGNGNEGG